MIHRRARSCYVNATRAIPHFHMPNISCNQRGYIWVYRAFLFRKYPLFLHFRKKSAQKSMTMGIMRDLFSEIPKK